MELGDDGLDDKPAPRPVRRPVFVQFGASCSLNTVTQIMLAYMSVITESQCVCHDYDASQCLVT